MAAKYPLEHLFEGRPACRKLFRAVRAYAESLGEVQTEATKTQVSFGAKTKFAWVWLPQLWTKQRSEESITVSFLLAYPVSDRRIAQTVEARPGRWIHHVVIEQADELDEQLKGWIAEAYQLAQP